jgi:hypothetical protein
VESDSVHQGVRRRSRSEVTLLTADASKVLSRIGQSDAAHSPTLEDSDSNGYGTSFERR